MRSSVDRQRILNLTLPPVFFFSSRRRHTRCWRDWSSDVCSSDLPLRARHYVPKGANLRKPRPLLVFFHGGGFALGDLDTHDAPCRALCRELDLHVLSEIGRASCRERV